MEGKSRIIFYHLPSSRHSKEALNLLRESGRKSDLEIEVIEMNSQEKIAAVAHDAFYFYGGPNKAPAVYDIRTGKFYEGLSEIKRFIAMM